MYYYRLGEMEFKESSSLFKEVTVFKVANNLFKLSAHKMGLSMRLFKLQVLSLFKLPFSVWGENRSLNDHLRADFPLCTTPPTCLEKPPPPGAGQRERGVLGREGGRKHIRNVCQVLVNPYLPRKMPTKTTLWTLAGQEKLPDLIT